MSCTFFSRFLGGNLAHQKTMRSPSNKFGLGVIPSRFMAHKQALPAEFLEKGDIHFLYQPKVNHAEVQKLDDVQRLFMVLSPHHHRQHGRPRHAVDSITHHAKPDSSAAPVGVGAHRLLVVTRKRLPYSRHRMFGFVEMVTTNAEDLRQVLSESVYHTKTRGERHQPPPRALAKGVYGIIEHGPHTHLAYAIELPKEFGEVQKSFNVQQETSYIMAVKRPDADRGPGKANLRDEYKPHFSHEHEKLFENRRYIPANPPTLLDYAGTELILIGIGYDNEEEFGVLGKELEDMRSSKLTEQRVFDTLKLENLNTDPLKGVWA